MVDLVPSVLPEQPKPSVALDLELVEEHLLVMLELVLDKEDPDSLKVEQLQMEMVLLELVREVLVMELEDQFK